MGKFLTDSSSRVLKRKMKGDDLMENQQKSISVKLSKARLVSGVFVFVVGQLTTLLIPLVTASGISPTWKTTLSGILFFVTPQLGIFAAIAILGKSGYDYLKSVIFSWLKKHVVPDRVGPVRYYIGLIMFVLPLLFGWVEPYCGHLIPRYVAHQVWFCVGGDLMFASSLLVLGGEFWDKIRALFIYDTGK
jgi:hypothetical protein